MKPDLSKIFDSFNNLNDQARYGILGGVVFFILLLDVFFLVMPQMGSISDMNDQMTKLSGDTEQVITDKARIGLIRKNLQESRVESEAISSKVRSLQEVPSILTTISSIANEYGVKIDQLTPEKGQQESLTSGSDGKYYGLPIVIKARCGYHMFGRFLNKLENQNLFFIMKDFIIQNEGNNTASHSFSLTIKLILVEGKGAQSKNL